MICNFYLSVAARKIVCADPSRRYTSMLLGREATNKQQQQSWEDLAADGLRWRSTLKQHFSLGKEKLTNAEVGKMARRTTSTDQRPHTNATFAAEIVSPTSVSTATNDAATIKQTGQPACTPLIRLDRRIGSQLSSRQHRLISNEPMCLASNDLWLPNMVSQ